MKNLPAGNYALSIAHAGHEVRLHGFLEIAKPYVFLLTDGSERTGHDMMMESIRVIDTAVKQDKRLKIDPKDEGWKRAWMIIQADRDPEQKHIKSPQIYAQILSQNTGFFEYYINFIASNLIRRNINYIVSDAIENKDCVQHMCRIMTDIALGFIVKNTGKQILQYDYSVTNPYDTNITDECIEIELDEEAIDRKLNAIIKYPLAIQDLKANFPLDINVILELRKMKDGEASIKQILKDINMGFVSKEFLRPYSFVDAENTSYEVEIEDKKEIITYADHIKPLQEKLQDIYNKI